MAVNLKNLVPGSQLTNAAATYYTASTGVTAKITNATACNVDVASHNLTVWIVPSGGTADNTNIVIDAKAIAAGATYTCPELVAKNIPPGATIQAKADTGAMVNLMVSGVEQS